uniref:Uncharacterized protein n=1 Tax=Arundo donax TaxID=35708 RepID=A0A0A8YT38_ARUDO
MYPPHRAPNPWREVRH